MKKTKKCEISSTISEALGISENSDNIQKPTCSKYLSLSSENNDMPSSMPDLTCSRYLPPLVRDNSNLDMPMPDLDDINWEEVCNLVDRAETQQSSTDLGRLINISNCSGPITINFTINKQ